MNGYNRYKRALACVLTVAISVSMITATASASTSSKLKNVKGQISSAQSQLNEGKKKANQLVSQLDDLNDQIADIEGDIAQIGQNIDAKKAEISAAQQKLNDTEARMEQQNDDLNQRLRVMYMNGGTGTLEEISEIMSMVSLGQTASPCIFYNLNGYYDDMKALLLHMIEKGLSSEEKQQGIYFADDLAQIVKIISKQK